MKYRKNFSVYKPNNKVSGSASQFQMEKNNECMFLEMANQVADKDSSNPYDWNSKLSMKLGMPDILALLTYLEKFEPADELKLFHQTPGGGNKILSMKFNVWKGRATYQMRLSSKGTNQPDGYISTALTEDEATGLRVVLRKAITLILGW